MMDTTASATPTLAPIDQRVHVALSPGEAFALFTEGIARWWPFRDHSCSDDALDVRFEPRAGGAVTELARNGDRHPWGTLSWWEPPHGFAMSWHPGSDPSRATQLTVRFTAAAGGCEVHLQHDGWAASGDADGARHDRYEHGWAVVLGRFVASAGVAA
jgi:hypothetical protein